jgi:hypothetical protein
VVALQELAAELAAAAGGGPPAGDFEYDPQSGTWSGTVAHDSGQTVTVTLTFVDAAGQPQAMPSPRGTETIEATGTATGPAGELDFDLAITDLADQDGVCRIDGNGSFASDAGSGTVVVDGLVSDKDDGDGYPESGVVVASIDGARVAVRFDGSRYAEVTVTAGGVTRHYTLDLETGQLV